jgi:hypothetical protein
VVEPSARARWKGILKESIEKIKTTTFFENGITQKPFFIFKLDKLVENYYLLFPLKPLEDDFDCLENIVF